MRIALIQRESRTGPPAAARGANRLLVFTITQKLRGMSAAALHLDVCQSTPHPRRFLQFHRLIQVQATLEGLVRACSTFALASFSPSTPSHIVILSRYSSCVTSPSVPATFGVFRSVDSSWGSSTKKLKTRARKNRTPELRIPLVLPCTFLTPSGFLLYRCSGHHHPLWLIFDVGAALFSASV